MYIEIHWFMYMSFSFLYDSLRFFHKWNINNEYYLLLVPESSIRDKACALPFSYLTCFRLRRFITQVYSAIDIFLHMEIILHWGTCYCWICALNLQHNPGISFRTRHQIDRLSGRRRSPGARHPSTIDKKMTISPRCWTFLTQLDHHI